MENINKERKNFFVGSIRLFDSLNDAISKAGGVPLDIEDLNNVSATSLLTLLSTNHIRFYFDEEEAKLSR